MDVKRRKCNVVMLSQHAVGRAYERLPGIKLQRIRSAVRHALADSLCKGAKVDWDGAVHVEMTNLEAFAVCHPMLFGGWAVRTIYLEGEEYEEEESQ